MKISNLFSKAKALTNRLFENNANSAKDSAEQDANATSFAPAKEVEKKSTSATPLNSRVKTDSAPQSQPSQQRSLEVLAKLRERLDSHLNLDEEVQDIFFDDEYDYGREEHDKVLNSLHDKSGKNLAPSIRGQEVTDTEVMELSRPTSSQNRYALAQLEQAEKEQGLQLVAVLDKEVEHTVGDSALEATKATYALAQLAKKAEKDEHSETEVTTSIADNPSNAKIKSYTYKASTSRTVVQVTNDDGSVTHSIVEKTELVNEETHSTASGKLETNTKVSRDVKTSTHQLNEKQVSALQGVLTAGDSDKFLLGAGSELEASKNPETTLVNANGQRLLQPLPAPTQANATNSSKNFPAEEQAKTQTTSLTPPSKGKKIKEYQFGKNKKAEATVVAVKPNAPQSPSSTLVEVAEVSSVTAEETTATQVSPETQDIADVASQDSSKAQGFADLLNSKSVSAPSFAELASKDQVATTEPEAQSKTIAVGEFANKVASQLSNKAETKTQPKKKIKGYQFGASKKATANSTLAKVAEAKVEETKAESVTTSTVSSENLKSSEAGFAELLAKPALAGAEASEASVTESFSVTTADSLPATSPASTALSSAGKLENKLSFEELYENPNLAEPQTPSFADLLSGNKASSDSVTGSSSGQGSGVGTSGSAALTEEKLAPRQTPPSRGKKIKGYKEKKNLVLEETSHPDSFASMFSGERSSSSYPTSSSSAVVADLPEVITGKDISQQATSSFMAEMMSGVKPLKGNEASATLAQAAKRAEDKKRLEQNILSRKDMLELEDRELKVDQQLREVGFISDINQRFTLEQIESGSAVYLAEGIDPEYLNYIKGDRFTYDEKVDLHAYTKEEAKKEIQRSIASFMRSKDVGVVLFITGHGTNELKANVPNYLIQLPAVIAMTTNREQNGIHRRVNGIRVVLRSILR